MSHRYRQLSLDDRRTIYQLIEARTPVSVIAARLGRHPSSIYRELKRNHFHDEDPIFRGYFPTVAHDKARGRRVRGGKLARDPDLVAQVVDRLHQAWSPEQIAGYLRRHRCRGFYACHETIYQYIYGAEGRRQNLYQLLPCARRRRRPRYGRKPRGMQIPLDHTIAQRPPEIGKRCSFGHWEGDLVAFRQEYGKYNLTSLVERRSRFTFLMRNPSRSSAGVMTGIQRKLGTLPHALRQSITFDRGTEFAAYPVLKQRLGIESYFCQPQAPWQKGSVENLNGRLRRFLPRETDVALLSDDELEAISARLNHTPRKCLDYRTPHEVLTAQLDVSDGDP